MPNSLYILEYIFFGKLKIFLHKPENTETNCNNNDTKKQVQALQISV